MLSFKSFFRDYTDKKVRDFGKFRSWAFLAKRSLLPRALRRFLIIEPYRRGEIEGPARILDAAADKSDPRFSRILEIRERLVSGVAPLPPRSVPPRAANCNVLFALHHSDPHNSAGYSVRSRHIIENLMHLGIDVTAVTRPGFPWDMSKAPKNITTEDWVGSIHYFRIPSQGHVAGESADRQFISGYAEALSQLIQEHDCSVVHSASNYPNGLAAAAAGRSTGARSIYEVRGFWHLSRATRRAILDGSPRFQYEESMEFETMQAVDHVVTLSEAMSDRIRSAGLAAERITVVPNAVDTERFKPLSPNATLITQLRLEGCFVIGFIGSLQEYEGLDLLIRAAKYLHDKGTTLAVLIVGDGPAYKHLAAAVRSNGAGDIVRMIGRVPFDDVSRYYSIIDACVFPRKDYEVCRLVPPLKILEAMAMQKAVIVSDVAPLLEMVTPDETGLAFRAGHAAELADCIALLAHNPELRSELAVNGRTWVLENRSWRQIAKRYVPIYRPQNPALRSK